MRCSVSCQHYHHDDPIPVKNHEPHRSHTEASVGWVSRLVEGSADLERALCSGAGFVFFDAQGARTVGGGDGLSWTAIVCCTLLNSYLFDTVGGRFSCADDRAARGKLAGNLDLDLGSGLDLALGLDLDLDCGSGSGSGSGERSESACLLFAGRLLFRACG